MKQPVVGEAPTGRRIGVWIVGAPALVAVIVLAAILRSATRVPPDNLGDFSDWQPTRAEVESALGRSRPGPHDDARHQRYVSMFKHRFRDHQFAVGLRFTDDHTVNVECAAMMSQWDMARVARMAQEEADRLFGGRHRARILETFISANARQIGELNPLPDGRVTIDFTRDYPPPRPRNRFQVTPTYIRIRGMRFPGIRSSALQPRLP